MKRSDSGCLDNSNLRQNELSGTGSNSSREKRRRLVDIMTMRRLGSWQLLDTLRSKR